MALTFPEQKYFPSGRWIVSAGNGETEHEIQHFDGNFNVGGDEGVRQNRLDWITKIKSRARKISWLMSEEFLKFEKTKFLCFLMFDKAETVEQGTNQSSCGNF